MKLIALDLDGTLFNNKSQISRENIKAIKEATASGINVVISTGRPFGGLPFEAIKGTGIRYAITVLFILEICDNLYYYCNRF